MITGDVIGGEEAVRRIVAITGRAPMEAVGKALYRAGEIIIADSNELVPVDEGTLRASAVVQLPEMTSDGVEVALGYGGAASDYAIVQHEALDFAHPNGGQAKFLETATVMNYVETQDQVRQALIAYYHTLAVSAGGGR